MKNLVFYIHPYVGASRATLRVDLDDETGMAFVTASLCSPLDTFSRRKGRLIADGRHAKRGADFGMEVQGLRRGEIVTKALRLFQERHERGPGAPEYQKGLPMWARNADVYTARTLLEREAMEDEP